MSIFFTTKRMDLLNKVLRGLDHTNPEYEYQSRDALAADLIDAIKSVYQLQEAHNSLHSDICTINMLTIDLMVSINDGEITDPREIVTHLLEINHATHGEGDNA